MAYRPTRLGAEVTHDPSRAAATIERALRRCGSVPLAADDLGVSRVTLWRWMGRLSIVWPPPEPEVNPG